jgi:transcription-repair coupling factor (superfamily II helicase)
MAEKAGLASISGEGGQLILRYPPLLDGEPARNIPDLGGDIRTGKNTIWIPISETNGWQEQLITVLQVIIEE